MKKLLMLWPLLALFVLALFNGCLPSPAQADLIRVNSANYSRDILVTDANGANVNGLSAGAFTVLQSKAGAAYSTVTPTITFKAYGHYSLIYSSQMTDTLGNSSLIITASGATQADVDDQIVGFDPQSDLGAAALATINTATANTYARLGAPQGASLSADINQVYNTASDIDGLVSTVPADTAARVWAATTRTLTAGGGGGGSGVTDSSVTADVQTAMTAQGATTARLAKLDNLDATVSGISARLFATVLAGVTFGDHVLNTSATVWGGAATTYPDSTHQTNVYSLGGTQYVSGSLTYNGSGKPTTRTTTLSNQ